jgi:hypothetical protein
MQWKVSTLHPRCPVVTGCWTLVVCNADESTDLIPLLVMWPHTPWTRLNLRIRYITSVFCTLPILHIVLNPPYTKVNGIHINIHMHFHCTIFRIYVTWLKPSNISVTNICNVCALYVSDHHPQTHYFCKLLNALHACYILELLHFQISHINFVISAYSMLQSLLNIIFTVTCPIHLLTQKTNI